MKSETLIPIVYEDDEIILINKKSGLASQGGVGVGKSVDTELAAQIGQKVYLCHRLDKDTSGLLLCAKTPAAANKWSRLVGEKSVKKLKKTVEKMNEKSFEVTLHTNKLYYQHFRSMNDYTTIFPLV